MNQPRAMNGLTRLKRANLTELLRLIHFHGELSRSQLAEEANITRSSVLGLVAELEDRGLVEQVTGLATGEIGRPSTLVRPSENIVVFTVAPLYDSIVVATVTFAGKVVRRDTRILQELPTPQEFTRAAAELIAEQTLQLDPHALIAGIGVAIPGHVRMDEGVVRNAYSLAWNDVPLAQMLSEATALPTWLANDGSLASLAEYRFGAGKGLSNLILLLGAVGGIGGGIIVDGNLVRGRDGFAGELGHAPISDDERSSYAGIPGSLDSMVNRLELINALGLARADDETLAAAVRRRAHEPELSALLEHQADYLGRALGMFINMFNPEAIVLTGYLRIIFEVRRDRVMQSVRRDALAQLAEGCEIRLDALGADILSIGAAELPLGQLIGNPTEHPLAKGAVTTPA